MLQRPPAQRPHQAVEAVVRVAGVTAHYVTAAPDKRPILTQYAFDMPPEATDDVDGDHQFGMPDAARAANPDRPVDVEPADE